MRGQDIYSSQDEATTLRSSSESEEAKEVESSEEIYPQEKGDLLIVKRLLRGQSCDLTQS